MTKVSELVAIDNTLYNITSNLTGRNRIINGDMRVAQRGTSFPTPANGAYTLDRWLIGVGGSAPASVTQVTGPTGFKNALRVTGAAGNTNISLQHRHESINVADMVGIPCSIQAVMSASAPQTVAWQLVSANALDNYSSSTVVASGTWSVSTTAQRFTATTGNLPAGAANGLALVISLNNGGAFTSGTFDLTGVQLEVGIQPTAFEFIDYGASLQRCLRYCWQDEITAAGVIYSGLTTVITAVPFAVRMRIAPAFTNITNGAGDSTSSVTVSGCSLNMSTPSYARLQLSSASSFGSAIGQACVIRGQIVRFDAEI